MKNSQRGFVVPLIIIIALLVVGGSYIYTHNKKIEVNEDTSLIATTTNQITSNKDSYFTINTPRGGETFKPGDIIHISWITSIINQATPIYLQIAQGTIDQCSEYTNNGSMGTCRAYEIYGGDNKGSFDYKVPSYSPANEPQVGPGRWLIRIYPEMTMGGGLNTENTIKYDAYSGFFTITQ